MVSRVVRLPQLTCRHEVGALRMIVQTLGRKGGFFFRSFRSGLWIAANTTCALQYSMCQRQHSESHKSHRGTAS